MMPSASGKVAYKRDYHPLPAGKSFYRCECPFCKGLIDIAAWAFHNGKKCSCGARFTPGGVIPAEPKLPPSKRES